MLPSEPENVESHDQKHAASGLMRAFMAVGLLAAGLGFVLLLLGQPLGLLPIVVGWLVFSVHRRRSRALAQVVTVNLSLGAIQRGAWDEAEARLAALERHHPEPGFALIIGMQKAMVMLARGEFEDARDTLDEAIEGVQELRRTPYLSVQLTHAISYRALARALCGDAGGAAADHKRVMLAEHPHPGAYARTILAEIVTMDRQGDRAAMRVAIKKHERLLFESTEPRERALVRAYTRMLAAPTGSAYRKAAPRDEDEPSQHGESDWVKLASDNAAPFCEPMAVVGRAAVDGEEADQGGDRHLASPVHKAPLRLSPWLFAFAIPFGGFVAWSIARTPGGTTSDTIGGFITILGAVGIAVAVERSMRAKRQLKELMTATTRLSMASDDVAIAKLEELATSRFATIAAQARLSLAMEALRDGDLREALDHCEAGLAELARYTERVISSDVLLPRLIEERAVLRACLGEPLDDPEMQNLPRAYPYRHRAQVRVRAIHALRGGELRRAARVIESLGNTGTLSPRDEALFHLVLVLERSEAISQAERARLGAELRESHALRAYIGAIDRDLLSRFEATVVGAAAPILGELPAELEPTRLDEEPVDDARAWELEQEAEAEHEASLAEQERALAREKA